mgnify:CR=1 FL=1
MLQSDTNLCAKQTRLLFPPDHEPTNVICYISALDIPKKTKIILLIDLIGRVFVFFAYYKFLNRCLARFQPNVHTHYLGLSLL